MYIYIYIHTYKVHMLDIECFSFLNRALEAFELKNDNHSNNTTSNINTNNYYYNS